MKNLILILIVYCVVVINIHSQPNEDWVVRFDGPGLGQDIGRAITVDNSGNVYVTGNSQGSSPDFVTIKYNSSGIEQWNQRYGVGGLDLPNAIAVDNSGNVYVAGQLANGGSQYDCVTIKYNSAGVQQWAKIYNGVGNGDDFAKSMDIDASGNVYITGYTFINSSDYDYITIKYNSSGDSVWVKRYNGPADIDYGSKLKVDGSGNVYVTGYSLGLNSNFDFTTIKYNLSGAVQWVRRYDGPANASDYPVSISVDNSANIYVAGFSTGIGSGFDYAVIKYGPSGDSLWAQRYNGPANLDDNPEWMEVDATGNVYMTGYSEGSGTGIDYATIKYNTNGVQQWVTRYNGPGNAEDHGTALKVDAGGNTYVTGYSNSSAGFDYATIKYNPAGVQQWLKRYNWTLNASDMAFALALDNSGNIYVTGGSTGTFSYDLTTIKYSQPLGIQPVSSEIPEHYSLSQNYPNPFNPNTKILFSIPSAGNADMRSVQLNVYNTLGQQIAVLVNDQLQPGTYEVNWNAANYPSGIYFYTLKAGSYFTATKKMILIK